MASAKQRTPEEFFEVLVIDWRTMAIGLAAIEQKYAQAYGKALAVAEGKTAEVREAAAVASVSNLRIERDRARIDEQSARWAVQYHLARAGRTGRFDG